jgi:hypothetical protein
MGFNDFDRAVHALNRTRHMGGKVNKNLVLVVVLQ